MVCHIPDAATTSIWRRVTSLRKHTWQDLRYVRCAKAFSVKCGRQSGSPAFWRHRTQTRDLSEPVYFSQRVLQDIAKFNSVPRSRWLIIFAFYLSGCVAHEGSGFACEPRTLCLRAVLLELCSERLAFSSHPRERLQAHWVACFHLQ